MEKLLNQLYLFEGLDESYIAKIEEISELRAYSPGELIFSQGDIADAIFMIQHGAVSIIHRDDDGEEVEIAKLGTGSHFGEMSMLDNASRSASASSAATRAVRSPAEARPAEPPMTTRRSTTSSLI